MFVEISYTVCMDHRLYKIALGRTGILENAFNVNYSMLKHFFSERPLMYFYFERKVASIPSDVTNVVPACTFCVSALINFIHVTDVL